MKKVMVSGCYDLLHAGHIVFFETAAKYGELYVCLGADDNIQLLKNHKPQFNENERLYMVQSVQFVHEARIASGSGYLDFEPDMAEIKPDIFLVNEDGDRPEKRMLCQKHDVKYVVLPRTPKEGLPFRSSTTVKANQQLPYRLCLAGGWMDQPFISMYASGSVVTVQIDPRDDFMTRGGLATSTRKTWEQLTKYNSKVDDCYELARILFGYENPPGKKYISGCQDAIGLTHPGVNRLDFNGGFWPENIETCIDEEICDWLEKHIVLVPLFERPESYDPLLQQNITRAGVQRLGLTGRMCFDAILRKDLENFGHSLTATHDAWRELLPLTTSDEIDRVLDSYNDQCTGRVTTGCGGGYVILATDQQIEDGLRISVRR
ncbi:MAG: cytidyltransferase [Kiritimatiellaceae bacterium]|nr:cytidyltransferase [Kiritimatiellaceae bacterium]